MKLPSKNVRKIVVSLTMIIFTLASGITGAYAWFVSKMSLSMTASMFSVTSIDATISSVTLYKFNYLPDGAGSYEYLFPEWGWVGSYAYDDSEGRKCFGEVVHNEQTGEDEWVPVTTMNLYDPLNGFITGHGLLGLNCNAIFKIVLHSSGLANSSVDINVQAASIQSSKSKEDDEIWLSSCVDFDMFLPSALNDERLVTDGYKNYLPDESEKYLPQDTEFDHPYEEEYYKISYLASLNETHSHFYGGSDPKVTIGRTTVNFVNGYATLYVNVNYAPSQLTSYEHTVMPDEIVKAVYDFLLEISS